MRQSQLEIKSIEAELKSIRADVPAQSVSLLEARGSAKSSLQESLNRFSQQDTQAASIAPTIVRPPAQEPRQESHQEQVYEYQLESSQTKPKREVECFPIVTQTPQNLSSAVSQAQLESVIEQLRHYSEAESYPRRQSSRRQANRKKPSPQVNAIRQLLEEKAKQINDLSTQQEAAILELMQISGQLNQDHQATKTHPQRKNELTLECDIAEIPYIERNRNGMFVLTNRTIEAKTRSELTAAALPHRRHHRNHNSLLARIGRWLTQPVLRLGTVAIGAVGLAGAKRQHRAGRRTTAPEVPVTLKEAATLVIGAALLRFCLDWIVVSYPMLWIPSILIMLTPAAFAFYRATVKPPTGFAWGYRLFAILIGLLLGGRL